MIKYIVPIICVSFWGMLLVGCSFKPVSSEWMEGPARYKDGTVIDHGVIIQRGAITGKNRTHIIIVRR